MNCIQRYVKNRKPNLTVFNDRGEVYLERWHIIPRNPYFNIYLHKFTKSYAEVLHDHPWCSLSYTISGVVLETILTKRPKRLCDIGAYLKERIVMKGAWMVRSSKMFHYITTLNQTPVWTIFITGPKIKEWGFLTERGLIHNLQYEERSIKGECNE